MRQMTRALKRLFYMMRRDGVSAAARKALAAAQRRPSLPDGFDKTFGVDTNTSVPAWKLSVSSRHATSGSNYQTIGAEQIERLLLKLPCRLPLIDLGCGKGRVLIIAHRLGFRPVTGVEFSSDLVDIARRNLQICAIPGQVLCQDAADVDFPNDCVIFMYNPFDAEVMTQVAKRVRESTAHIYLVYVNAKCHHLFQGLRSIYTEPGVVILANR
jgi:SAM-dependent methyltransferase